MRMMRNAIGTRQMIGDHAALFKKKGPPIAAARTNSDVAAPPYLPHGSGLEVSFATTASPKAQPT
jgi:hypothetical protein